MAEFFDEQKWEKLIKKPDWYLFIVPELNEIKKGIELQNKDIREKYKREVYGFFEKHLDIGDINLGVEVGNWDKERKPIDTIIIHHTKNSPRVSKEILSAAELIRLYAPYYYNPVDDADIKGMSISSGHIRNGKQVFYPYHWIIRENGDAEQLLFDEETGWQSGNWEINCRSIAIVFDNNYENSKPSDEELQSVANLIRSKYQFVDKKRIFGHREVKSTTTCPSNLFLSAESKRGWKEDLLDLI